MKILKAVKSNKGIESEYRKRLEKLVDAMDKSVMFWILADYGNRTPKEMAVAIQKRIKQWTKVFGEKSGDIALWFAKTVKKHTEMGFRMALGEQGIVRQPEVDRDTFNAVRLENDDLIKSIPEKYFTGISTVAMLALLYDWDKDKFQDEIEKRHDITKRRVKTIASDQNHKSNVLFSRAICQELGIDKAIWVYTFRSNEPRINHVAADGTVFDLDKGCLIDGEYIFPAEKINCKCDFRAVIPEIGDEVRNKIEKNRYFKIIARGVK